MVFDFLLDRAVARSSEKLRYSLAKAAESILAR
jgi:hypothetical protein